MNHIKNIKDRYDFDIKEINMGGGFGVTYTDEQRKSYSYFLDPLMDRVREFYQEENAKDVYKRQVLWSLPQED